MPLSQMALRYFVSLLATLQRPNSIEVFVSLHQSVPESNQDQGFFNYPLANSLRQEKGYRRRAPLSLSHA